MKQILKSLIYYCLNILYFSSGKKFSTILMYHSVENNKVFFMVKPEIFEKQLIYLKNHGYRTIFLSELVDKLEKKIELNNKDVVITFDDGFEDNYTIVFPLMKKYGFKSTVFLSTGFLEQEMPNSSNLPLKTLNWEQIVEMHKSGIIDFQPHTVNHPDLTKRSSENAKTEIMASKKEIEEKLRKNCDFFAYPKGKYDKTIIDLVIGLGFKAAVTVGEGVIQDGVELFELKRNSIDSSVNLTQFIGKISYSVKIFRKLFS